MGDGVADRVEPQDDLIRPFQIESWSLRGRLIRLGPVLDQMISQHRYPPPVARMLGEAVALAAALAGALKFDGIFTLQTKGDGPIRFMVVDVTSAGAVRGYAQYDAEALSHAAQRRGDLGNSVPGLLGAGYLAFTVDQGEHTERYQGIVELDGASLAECIQHYFRQSEQIEAGLRVAVAQGPGGWRAGALMVQRLPADGGIDGIPSHLSLSGEFAREAHEDGWRQALILLGTCRDAELTDAGLSAESLLFRLFHEEGVRVYPAQPLAAQCRCSRERVLTILGQLPDADIDDLTVEGQVVVTCEFCSTPYIFAPEELVPILG